MDSFLDVDKPSLFFVNSIKLCLISLSVTSAITAMATLNEVLGITIGGDMVGSAVVGAWFGLDESLVVGIGLGLDESLADGISLGKSEGMSLYGSTLIASICSKNSSRSIGTKGGAVGAYVGEPLGDPLGSLSDPPYNIDTSGSKSCNIRNMISGLSTPNKGSSDGHELLQTTYGSQYVSIKPVSPFLYS